MYILDEGTGTWDGSIRNAQNPTRRDIHTIRAGGFAAMQFEADNPGVWRKFRTTLHHHTSTTQTDTKNSLPLPRSLALVRRPRHERRVAARRHSANPQRHARDVRRLGLVQLTQRCRPDRCRLIAGWLAAARHSALLYPPTFHPPTTTTTLLFLMSLHIVLSLIDNRQFLESLISRFCFSITTQIPRGIFGRGGEEGWREREREIKKENVKKDETSRKRRICAS